MKTLRFLTFTLSLTAATLAVAPFVRAENKEDKLGFYPRDTAKTVFGSGVEMTMPKFDDTELDGNPPSTDAAIPPAAPQNAPLTVPVSTQTDPIIDSAQLDLPNTGKNDKSELRASLAKKYGSPTAEPKMRVQDNAPPAFKAMMEALDGGDKELAYDYARQYAKSLQKDKENYSRVVSMFSEAMKDNGQARGTEWEKIPALEEDKAIAEKRRNDIAQELLAKATKEQLSNPASLDALVGDESEVPNIAKLRHRESIQLGLSKIKDLPTSADGTVNVVYLFDPKQIGKMRESAIEINNLSFARQSDTRVQIIGATIAPSSDEEISSVKKATRTRLTLKDGAAFASKLGITTAPAIVIMIPNHKGALIQEGAATTEYLDELISKIQGTKTK